MTAITVISVTLLYVTLLFVIAWLGDVRSGTIDRLWRSRWFATPVYCLTLTVYNTSWSFYGSVGRATSAGWTFLPIYIGPVLVLVFCQPLLRRLVAIAKAQNATSLSDLLAARYGKSQLLAAVVTLCSLAAVLPYIALQLKALAVTFDIVTGLKTPADAPIWRDTSFASAILMAIFVVTFGVRYSHSSERHRGLMLAVAMEGVIKLLAFVIVGMFIVFGFFDGPGDILGQAIARIPDDATRILAPNFALPGWYGQTLIAGLALICMPHLFQVVVVESERSSDLNAARIFFPAYLGILSLFMVPIALAGLLTFGDGVAPDSFVIALPIAFDSPTIAALAFFGGLSAATGMTIVATLSLATMLCNDVIMPVILRRRKDDLGGEDVSATLLRVRRVAVAIIMLLAFAMHRLVVSGYPLTEIGLVSFVATAQFGPAVIVGIYSSRPHMPAAVAGIVGGLTIWAWMLLLPRTISTSLLPPLLPGLGESDPITAATVLSLAANLALLYAFSRHRSARQADGFASPAPAVETLADLKALAVRFIGADATERGFRQLAAQNGNRALDHPVDSRAIDFTENLLAGAIGTPSARVVMTAALRRDQPFDEGARRALETASEVLRLNYQLLQGTLDGVRQGICAFDNELRITAWNRRFCEVLAFPSDLLRVGMPLAEVISFNLSREEYSGHDIPALVINRDLARQRWPYIYERKRPDGTVLEITYDRIGDQGYVSTYTDVTERHRAAERLRAANEGLEERVAQRTRQLQAAKSEAERANAGKSQFIAAASHDLLQPLNAARLFVSAIAEELRPARSGTARETAELAANAGDALSAAEALIEALMDISAFDGGAIHPKVRPFRLSDILEPLENEFRMLASDKGLAFRARACPLVVESDPQLLRRLLQNLLSNAVRHTERGGVLLGWRRRGDSVRIEIWDTGTGIPADQHDAIFREFYRIRPPGGGATPGLGLGLAIVERTARLLGHPIGLRSQPGRGSLFHITVALAREQRVPSPERASRPGETTRTLDILVVDDDARIRSGMVALIERWGHRVTVSDGTTLPDAPPDLLLVDYHLDDDRTGFDFVAQANARWGRTLRIAFLTADRSAAIAERVRAAHALLLYKPVKPAALRRVILDAERAE
ncbi:hybrid sensor histidine kinase/response regulator [Sphingomonas hengshuiensis]|uniref:histidine kinase n=1 Tax=Sphingomonas hengshuiensis TaxID=1609977 RepID=A0A7U4J929_9SPHN|nr:PAS domain-containing hybrid sensor histidine kinase/response regulator [Sphingomonas hengshuiensis]AJP72412.1 hypothetical protein TS85_12385 [Sphingomonas hengshuiensis]